MRFALIKNNIAVDVVIADQNFIDLIKNNYDECIQVTDDVNAASCGDTYNPENETFTREVSN